jgi:hypothetical protein
MQTVSSQMISLVLSAMKIGKEKKPLTECTCRVCNHDFARECVKAKCSCCEMQDVNAMLNDDTA